MKLLVLGASGQVGHELARRAADFAEVLSPGRNSLDLSDLNALSKYLGEHRPEMICNAAAYTAVDRAESEPRIAHLLNGAVPGALAAYARTANAMLVHYSTDYVFDGASPRPYVEEDQPLPLNVYGESKLQGEEAIIRSGCAHLILRTSWIYSVRGSNFLKTMVRLLSERKEIRVVNDQVGAPTSAVFLADSTCRMIRRLVDNGRSFEFQSIYHLAAAGSVSWFGFAQAIRQALADRSQVPYAALLPIPTSEYPTPARRPLNSCLSSRKVEDDFSLRPTHWKEQLAEVMDEILL